MTYNEWGHEDLVRRIRTLEAGIVDAIECLEAWSVTVPESVRTKFLVYPEQDAERLRSLLDGDFCPWWAHAVLAKVSNEEVWI